MRRQRLLLCRRSLFATWQRVLARASAWDCHRTLSRLITQERQADPPLPLALPRAIRIAKSTRLARRPVLGQLLLRLHPHRRPRRPTAQLHHLNRPLRPLPSPTRDHSRPSSPPNPLPRSLPPLPAADMRLPFRLSTVPSSPRLPSLDHLSLLPCRPARSGESLAKHAESFLLPRLLFRLFPPPPPRRPSPSPALPPATLPASAPASVGITARPCRRRLPAVPSGRIYQQDQLPRSRRLSLRALECQDESQEQLHRPHEAQREPHLAGKGPAHPNWSRRR